MMLFYENVKRMIKVTILFVWRKVWPQNSSKIGVAVLPEVKTHYPEWFGPNFPKQPKNIQERVGRAHEILNLKRLIDKSRLRYDFLIKQANEEARFVIHKGKGRFDYNIYEESDFVVPR